MPSTISAVTQHRAFPALASAALAALVSLYFLSQNPAAGLPLDDAYIHLQYGWQAAHGQMLQYNPGGAPTTGATSWLYMLLLALGFAAGLSREAMPPWVLISGAFTFGLTSALVADAARRAATLIATKPAPAGLLAGMLFAGSGWMGWAFLSGMETGWLILFVTVALWALAAGRRRLQIVATGLAIVTRPEAALFALVLLLVEFWKPERRVRWAALPLAAIFIPPLLNWAYTGSPSATGLLAKSWFTLQPMFPLTALQLTAQTFGGLLWMMGGPALDGRWHAFPLLQLLALCGCLALWRIRGARPFVLAASAWSVGLLAVSATLQTATWHHHRYQMPALSAAAILGSIGLLWLTARWRPAARVTLLLAGLWSVYSVGDFAAAYRHDLDTLARMQRPLADWLRAHTPPEARVAVHDVGVMRFFGERDTLDVVGLTSAGMVEAYRHGPGALYEALRREQPDYFAVYPEAAPPFFGLSHATELLGEELYRVTVPDYSPYTSAAATQTITRADWSAAALADSPQQPDLVARSATLTRTDSLNVADLGDERAHAFTWSMANNLPGFASDARRMRYRASGAITLADGGRGADGSYGFRVAARAGEPLLLVARVHQTEALRVRVSVNGDDAGEWRLPAIPGAWLESAFVVPAGLITRDFVDVTLTVQPGDRPVRFNLFYVWAFAGERATQPPEPRFPLTASFGDVADLVGYDLPRTTFAPGETLPLTLYWRGLRASAADWRVFVHLTDRRDDTATGIRAQWDAAPRAGTYPFWVWGQGERVSETITLAMPKDAEPGDHYALFVGIYDSASGLRAPVTSEARYEGERVLLTPIVIERR